MDKKEQKKVKGQAKAASTLKDLRPKKDAKVKGGSINLNSSRSNVY